MTIGDQTFNAAALPQFQASDIEWNMDDFLQSQYSPEDANAQHFGLLDQPLLNNWDPALAATNDYLLNAGMTIGDQTFKPAALSEFQTSDIEWDMVDLLQSQYSLENGNAQGFSPFAANTFEASSESWSPPGFLTDDVNASFEAQSDEWSNSIHQDMQPPLQPVDANRLDQIFEGMVDLPDDGAQTFGDVLQDPAQALPRNEGQATKAADSIMNTPAHTGEPAQDFGEMNPGAGRNLSAGLSSSNVPTPPTRNTYISQFRYGLYGEAIHPEFGHIRWAPDGT